MIPRQSDLEVPLLKALVVLGGAARPHDVYPRVIEQFDYLTEADKVEMLESGTPKLTNRIQWVRQRLVEAGQVSSPERGVWAITEKGRQRLAKASPGVSVAAPPQDFLSLYEDYERLFRQTVLARLLEMTPTSFERFARKLMEAYGFTEVTVTAASGDSGIDGYGRLRVGLSLMDVAFQCKRWQANVPRPEIDKFRGAIQGQYQQGVFFTTADFSTGARDASIRPGAVPIVLINGEGIVELMIDKEFGVRRRPLTRYEEMLAELQDVE